MSCGSRRWVSDRSMVVRWTNRGRSRWPVSGRSRCAARVRLQRPSRCPPLRCCPTPTSTIPRPVEPSAPGPSPAQPGPARPEPTRTGPLEPTSRCTGAGHAVAGIAAGSRGSVPETGHPWPVSGTNHPSKWNRCTTTATRGRFRPPIAGDSTAPRWPATTLATHDRRRRHRTEVAGNDGGHAPSLTTHQPPAPGGRARRRWHRSGVARIGGRNRPPMAGFWHQPPFEVESLHNYGHPWPVPSTNRRR